MGKGRVRVAGPARQRYYPQCALCSGKQSNVVRMGKDMLVFHFYGMRPWYYAGKAPPCYTSTKNAVLVLNTKNAGKIHAKY